MHAKPTFGAVMFFVAAMLLFVSAAGPAGDDTADKLTNLAMRVQRLEDALGVTGRDLANVPLTQRLEKLEQSVAALRAAIKPPKPERQDRTSARDLELIKRAQQDMQHTLDRVQRAIQDTRHGGDDSRRLESQLDSLQRSLGSLESRVSRLERG